MSKRQRLRQNKEHFQQRVAEERTRHPIADGHFTPANDADYQADVRQIQRDFEQRMTEVAEEIRDLAMKKAYERHDIRKGEWNADADYHKRQLAIRRHEQSRGRTPREDAYAKSRPMPTDAEQVAGFPPPPSPPSSPSTSSRSSFSTHPLSVLPAHVLHAARSALHQLEHSAKHTVQSLGPAFFAWEKRASNSHAPGVRKVGGRLGAELEAAPSW
ncbi:MAG: hypothetical protein M1826_004675 [Phylliscum demangeonii]|nr:MAG: hypothetical protein M1826_004675 [Phylliscum demangeonii]